MKDDAAILLRVGIGVLGLAVRPRETNDTSTVSSRRFDLHFTRSTPYATPAEAARRRGIKPGGKGYALAAEKFQIIVPGPFSANVA